MKKKDVLYIIIPPIIQSILYFTAKLFAHDMHLLESSIDRYIPFIEYFVYFYIIWYLLLIIVPFIIFKYDKDNLNRYNKIYLLGSVICFIIFIIYPTTINRVNIRVDNFSKYLVSLIYYFDKPILNCFPSLHVLNCMMWLLFITNNKKVPKKIRLIITILSLGIIVSTLFIKQHVVYDLIGSVVVLLISYTLIKLFDRRKYENRNC